MAVPNTQIEAHSTIGRRIHVIGNSTSGKSTLAARLGEVEAFAGSVEDGG